MNHREAQRRRARAYLLRQAGLTFKQIAGNLGISKTRARELVLTHAKKDGWRDALADDKYGQTIETTAEELWREITGERPFARIRNLAAPKLVDVGLGHSLRSPAEIPAYRPRAQGPSNLNYRTAREWALLRKMEG